MRNVLIAISAILIGGCSAGNKTGDYPPVVTQQIIEKQFHPFNQERYDFVEITVVIMNY